MLFSLLLSLLSFTFISFLSSRFSLLSLNCVTVFRFFSILRFFPFLSFSYFPFFFIFSYVFMLFLFHPNLIFSSHLIYCSFLLLIYKVVQIWPGLILCKQVTVCPGHIWTTLFFHTFFFLNLFRFFLYYLVFLIHSCSFAAIFFSSSSFIHLSSHYYSCSSFRFSSYSTSLCLFSRTNFSRLDVTRST
jgi:hypothetical protein